MSSPPAQSSSEHRRRVNIVAYLLAYVLCENSHQAGATNEELGNILIETTREALRDVRQQPTWGVPWSAYLSSFRDTVLGEIRSMPTFTLKLFITWLNIFILLPLFLLYNISLFRCPAIWFATLVVRWYVCLRGYHGVSAALRATIRATALQHLPDLTGDEADRMVVKIIVLAIVVRLLRMPGI